MPWYATLKSNIETVEYNGKIGCVTVPSSFILVKKGNCIMVSGNSGNAKAFYPEETIDFDIEAEDFDSSHPKFKPYRSKSKNGGYAIIYGCSAGKLASTLGKPVSLGTILLEAFWKVNQGLKDLKDALESYWENHGDGRWIPGIDGRRLYSRSKHSLINLLFQSTGAIIVDYSTVLFDHYLGGLSIDELGRPYYPYKGKKVKRILYFHDEFQTECPIEYGQEIGELMERCMSEAGERLKLSIPLTGNSAIGPTWRDTH
jgi:DNA polymerase I-like protein with 3'-5' exonuclease and polymerase domains